MGSKKGPGLGNPSKYYFDGAQIGAQERLQALLRTALDHGRRRGTGASRGIADHPRNRQTSDMNAKQAALICLFLSACSQSLPSDQSDRPTGANLSNDKSAFLRMTGNDTWVNWPSDWSYVGSGEQPCVRVSEMSREAAIRLLAQESALAISRNQYKELTGEAQPGSSGSAFLLRGFATDNSAARVTSVGDVVTVHSDALGGLLNPRRYPCAAMLKAEPSTVYTVAAYDL